MTAVVVPKTNPFHTLTVPRVTLSFTLSLTRMLQTMAANVNGFGVSAANVVELEAGFAPLEAAFTAPAFCRRVLGRLSAPEFRALYADGGNMIMASVARHDRLSLSTNGVQTVIPSLTW